MKFGNRHIILEFSRVGEANSDGVNEVNGITKRILCEVNKFAIIIPSHQINQKILYLLNI